MSNTQKIITDLNKFTGLVDEIIKIRVEVSKGVYEDVFIKKFNDNASNLVNKSIILYGPSGSGKTTIIKHLLYIIQDYYPIAFGLLPTNNEKHDFDNIFHPMLIFDKVSLTWIRKLSTRQREMTDIYNEINKDLVTLESLYNMCNKRDDQVDKLIELKNTHIRSIPAGVPEDVKKKQIERIKQLFNENVKTLYKKNIYECSEYLLNKKTLSEREILFVKNININPNVLFLTDDAYTEIKDLIAQGNKLKDDELKNFFFKGRHRNITHIHGFQADKIDTEIRNNAMISIFSNQNAAAVYFDKKANGFLAKDKKITEQVINTIFGSIAAKYDKSHPLHHIKLVHSRLDEMPFSYIIADVHDDSDIRLCSDHARMFCASGSKQSTDIKKSKIYEKLM